MESAKLSNIKRIEIKIGLYTLHNSPRLLDVKVLDNISIKVVVDAIGKKIQERLGILTSVALIKL